MTVLGWVLVVAAFIAGCRCGAIVRGRSLRTAHRRKGQGPRHLRPTVQDGDTPV